MSFTSCKKFINCLRNEKLKELQKNQTILFDVLNRIHSYEKIYEYEESEMGVWLENKGPFPT